MDYKSALVDNLPPPATTVNPSLASAAPGSSVLNLPVPAADAGELKRPASTQRLSLYAGNNNRSNLQNSAMSSKRGAAKSTVRMRTQSGQEEETATKDDEEDGSEVEIIGDKAYNKHIGRGHSKKGQVMALRERSTKNLTAGFRKKVWKQVCLVLRDESMELFKTPSEETSHLYIELSEVESVKRKQGLECGFEVHNIMGEQVLELRSTTEAEADEWVEAISTAAAL